MDYGVRYLVSWGEVRVGWEELNTELNWSFVNLFEYVGICGKIYSFDGVNLSRYREKQLLP